MFLKAQHSFECSITQSLILITTSIYNEILNHFSKHLNHILYALGGDPFNDNLHGPCSTNACNLQCCRSKMEGRIDLLHTIRWERLDLLRFFEWNEQISVLPM